MCRTRRIVCIVLPALLYYLLSSSSRQLSFKFDRNNIKVVCAYSFTISNDRPGDAQEKQAHSYELAFNGNKTFVNSEFGVHLF